MRCNIVREGMHLFEMTWTIPSRESTLSRSRTSKYTLIRGTDWTYEEEAHVGAPVT